MENFEVVVRNKATQRGWRVAVAAAFAVALGLIAVVALARGQGSARSDALAINWEAVASQSVHVNKIGSAEESRRFKMNVAADVAAQDVPQKMRVGGYASVLKGAKAMQMSLSLQTSKLPFNFQYYNGDEDTPPFEGKDIAGKLADGEDSGAGGSVSVEWEPALATSDYALYGPAMTFAEHDTVSRRMRDMTDDDGAPLKANSYVTTATDKSFIKPLMEVPADYGTLEYNTGKEGMYKNI